HRLAHRVAEDVPDLFRLPKSVNQNSKEHAQCGANARRFRWRSDAAIERVHHAAYDEKKWCDLRDGLEFLFPRIAEIDGVRAESTLPNDEQCPQYEQAGQH